MTGIEELEEINEDIKTDPVIVSHVEESLIHGSAGIPVTGVEVISRLTPGTRVVRGPDWKWGDQVR